MNGNTGRFIFWLCAFAAAVILANTGLKAATRSLDMTPGHEAPAAPAVPGIDFPALEATASSLFAALSDAGLGEVSNEISPLPPAVMADRLHARYLESVNGWASKRQLHHIVYLGVSLDSLTRVFRFAFDGGQAVGIVREPRAFDEPGFDESRFPSGATDMMRVAIITPYAAGSRVALHRFDGTRLAGFVPDESGVPQPLRALEGQLALATAPFNENGRAGLKVFRTATLPVQVVASRRLAAIVSSGSTADLVVDTASQKVIHAGNRDWRATIAISGSPDGFLATEIIDVLQFSNRGRSIP